MKSLVTASGVILVVGSLAAATCADERPAAVPQSSLANMGFGSVQPLSDDDGLAVRGKGTSSIHFSNGDFGKHRFPKHLNGMNGRHDHGRNGFPKHDICKRVQHGGFKHDFNHAKNGHKFFGGMTAHKFGSVSFGHPMRW